MTGPAGSSARSGLTATGMVLAVLSAGTFGTSGIAGSALIGSGWSPAAAAVARLGRAAVLLAVPALLQLRGRRALLRQGAGKVTTYGLIAIGGGQLFYFNAIEYMPIGIIWGLLEAVSLAIYFLLSAAGTEETLPPLVMAWSGLSVGAAFLAVAGGLGIVPLAARASDVELLHRHLSWIVPVLELSLVAAVIAYTAGIAAARRLGAKLASLIGIAEVFFAVLYAWLLLGQRPSPMEFTVGAFMLVGVILVRADENGALAGVMQVVMLGQHVIAEIVGGVTPHRVDVIAVALSVVVLDEQRRTLDAEVVPVAARGAARPGEGEVIEPGAFDGAQLDPGHLVGQPSRERPDQRAELVKLLPGQLAGGQAPGTGADVAEQVPFVLGEVVVGFGAEHGVGPFGVTDPGHHPGGEVRRRAMVNDRGVPLGGVQ